MLKAIPATVAGILVEGGRTSTAQAGPATTCTPTKRYQGRDLSGWEIALGDALYARAGEDPVALDDIKTVHTGNYSELYANVRRRVIMAHNITFERIVEDKALHYIHTAMFEFRLPYLPVADETAGLNAQTLEGGLFIWDGGGTRLDYGIAFQWGLNPWDRFGEVRTWTDINGGRWAAVGHLAPDTGWHELKMAIDYPRQTTALWIDNQHYLTRYTATPKPETWGTETAARLQVEIVSIYPEPAGLRAMHAVRFRDWTWDWERVYCASLPMVHG
jgi:hypothetical protein